MWSQGVGRYGSPRWCWYYAPRGAGAAGAAAGGCACWCWTRLQRCWGGICGDRGGGRRGAGAGAAGPGADAGTGVGAGAGADSPVPVLVLLAIVGHDFSIESALERCYG